MRAIIDADHLPTAVRYYNAFPGEPAQQLKDFISIDYDKHDAAHHLTLESLLKELDSTGEKEYLLVLHSDPNGLLLPLGTGPLASRKADKTVLNMIRQASMAFGLMDDNNDPDLAKNAALLSAWMDFFSQVPQANTASITAASGIVAQCAEAGRLCQTWIDMVCKALHITEARLRELAALADKVRRSGLNRLEFRSCRLGAGNGLAEVASFFGAWSCAPTVRTFYVHQPVQIVPRQKQLNRIAMGLGPHSRRFTSSQAAAGPTDDVAFAIHVIRLEDASYRSHMFAISTQAIFNWTSRFIERLPTLMTVNGQPVPIATGRTLSRDLVVAGFWTPGSVKPFVFPMEDEYPGYLESQEG
jgi:hypothetical protein